MAAKFKACSVDGCNGNSATDANGKLGFCSSHYGRFKRHGDPLSGRIPNGEAFRFAKDAVLWDKDNCLIWPHAKDRKGYGKLSVNGKYHSAHRLVCLAAHGDAPTPKHEVAHSCGNGHGGCVNPKHLRWATHSENLSDKMIHGTHDRGERNARAKLTEEQVLEIRRLNGVYTQKALGEMFGVSEGAINYIMLRKNWAWLTK